jgi:hypothetical protein
VRKLLNPIIKIKGHELSVVLKPIYVSEEKNLWVVPFTAGEFLHVALISLLPELVAEKDKKESLKQVFGLLTDDAMFLVTSAF